MRSQSKGQPDRSNTPLTAGAFDIYFHIYIHIHAYMYRYIDV